MRSTGPRRSTARRERLELIASTAAFAICVATAVFLAFFGSSQFLLFVASLCAAVALFELAVTLSTRFRP
ncbi:hypothetical protein [Kribbella sp. NPDC049584]|uniref:hypothetical protein n=1 Tax=Kribbella sp. NPDC049584 TaxID=3154833 RepID=UPI003441C161